MKRIIFFLFCLISSFSVFSQLPTQTTPSRVFFGLTRQQWTVLDSPIVHPTLDSFYARHAGTEILRIQGGDTALWFYGGNRRWFRQMNVRDTASMLLPYLRKADTTNKWWSKTTRFVDTMYRVNDSTVGYTILGLAHTFEIKGGASGGGGGGSTDTTVVKAPMFVDTTGVKDSIYLRYGATLTIRPSDSALIADTTSYLATKNNLLAKVNYSDTSTMLTPYLRKADTTAMLNPYPRGSGVAGQISFWNDTRSLTGDTKLTFNSTSNEVTTDSITLIRAVLDSLRFRPYPVVRLAAKIVNFGNSITEGSAASPIGDSAYVILLKNYLQLLHTNRAISGAGIKSVTTRHFAWMNTLHDSMTTVMIGFNDIHANNINGATGFKTKNMLYNGLNSVFANHFLRVWLSASDNTGPVTRHGSWTTGYQDSRNGQKGTNNCAFTSTQNDSIKYTAVDSTFVIGLIGGDGSAGASIGTTVQIYVDGVLNQTISTNNQADNVLSLSPDNADGGRERGPMAVIISGLTYASHTIKVVKSGATGFLIMNYFGNLRSAINAPPFVMFHIPWMKAAGYATTGNSSTVKTDTMNAKYDSLRATWPVAYPVYVVRTNNFYDTTTGTSVDNVHPNNTGHRQIFEAAEDVLPSIFKTAFCEGCMFFTDKFYGDKKNISGTLERRFFIMDDIFYGDTSNNIRNRSLLQSFQTGSFKLTGESQISNKLHLRGMTVGGPSTTFDSIMNIGVNSSLRPYIAMNFSTATTDNKRWDIFAESSGGNSLMFRAVNDANSSATEVLRIFRNALVPDSMRIISNRFTVYSYNVVGASGIGGLAISTGPTGKVGVGIKVPAYKLDVFDSTTSQTSEMRVGNFSNAGATVNTNAGALNTYTGYFNNTATRGNGTDPLTNYGIYATASGAQANYAAWFDAGNVGIGTSAPSAKLHLVGSLRLDLGSDATLDLFYRSSGGNIARLATGTALQQLRVNSGATGYEWFTPSGSGITSINSETGPAFTVTAANGLTTTTTTNTATTRLGGALTGSTDITGSFPLNLGTSGSKLSAFGINSSNQIGLNADTYIALNGQVRLKYNLATDADFTVTSNMTSVYLPTISANRTLTMPSTVDVGAILVVHNENSAGFSWNISGSLQDKSNGAVSSLSNDSVYIIQGTDNGSSTYWKIIALY